VSERASTVPSPHPISVSDLSVVGFGLTVPECVVVSRSGRVFVSNGDQLAEVLADGTVRCFGHGLGHANGIAIVLDGRIVATDFSPRGGLRLVDPDTGEVEDLQLTIDGRPLAYTNYPVVDSHGSIWVSCSTRDDHMRSLVAGLDDGYIARVDPGGAVVAADGVHYANGLALDADEAYLYCCRTSLGDVVRFRVAPDRSLGPPERYGPALGHRRADEFTQAAADAAFADPGALRRWGLTDGCGFDQAGNLWVTVVSCGRVCAITPDQKLVTVIDDRHGTTLQLPSNVSWGGPDLRDLYIGSVGLPHVLKLTSPVPGLPLAHQR